MKKYLFIYPIALLFMSYTTTNDIRTVRLAEMPTTLEAFTSLQKEVAITPEGGAAMFIVALNMYQHNEAEGTNCLTAAAGGAALTGGKQVALKGYELKRLKEQMSRYPALATAYFTGAGPENNYQPDTAPYVIVCSTNPYSGKEAEGKIKLFVHTQGADSPRPIKLVKTEDGLWKVSSYGSIITGIKPAK